jgi:MFS family permease
MAVTLGQSILMFASFLWKPYWSLYIIELGGSKSAVGGLATLQAFSNLLLMFLGGILADRFGRKRVILVSSLFSVAPPIIFLYSSHWTTLTIGILVSSLSALAIPAQNALIAESLPQEKRAMAFGFYTMSWYLFIVVAYPFGGYMMDSLGVVTGTHLGLIFSLLVMIPIILLQWRFIKETYKPTTETVRTLTSPKAFLKQLRSAPPQLWVLFIVAILSSFGFQVFWSFVTVYCVQVIGMNMMQWSITSVAGNLVAAVFMMPSGILSDRAKRKPYIIASQALTSVTSLGYIASTSYPGVLVTRILGGLGEGLGGNVFSSVGGPVWQALVIDVAPENFRGSVLGLMGAVTGFASSPAPIVGGYLYENVSPQSPFYLSFALGTLGFFLVVFAVKNPKKLNEQH